MIKLMYVIRGTEMESYPDFKTRIFEFAQSVSSKSSIIQLKITLTDIAPPKTTIIPFKKSKIAVISCFVSNAKENIELSSFDGLTGGYVVDEATPVHYQKTWENGKATPGVCLLTLFRQRPDLDYKTFIDRWHNSHTPLSLKIHPLWNYSRNVVKDDILEGSEYWDGIVEEQFRTNADLLNPLRFFGNPLTMVYNMMRVYTDTRSFIEYKTIEPYLATEYHIKGHK